MDRRTMLALALTAIVIVATPLLFPGPKPAPKKADSVAIKDSVATQQPTTGPAPASPPQVQVATTAPRAAASAVRPETTLVRTNRAVFAIASPGGTPVQIELPAYQSLATVGATRPAVRLLEPRDRLIQLRLASERDTIAFDTVAFHAAPRRREGSGLVQQFLSVSLPSPITLTYRFPIDSFVVHLDGAIATPSPASGWRLLVTLPVRIRSEEANTQDDTRHLAIGYKVGNAEVASVTFRQIEPGAMRVDTGAIRWVTERNKYFVVAVVPQARDSSFRALTLAGGPRVGGEATSISATATLPLRSSAFALTMYAGPQSWDHLRRTASDLENVNPYGGWLHGVVQPFATIVMRLLLWMRHTLNVSYGWVLVIFGVLVRLLLWPLNQNAMRNSMKLQRIQPQLTEIQSKYARDPEKQRDAMMKMYQEHGMSPFTPVLGCLPMLLPMPILFALYFVFQNTIELRGVSFLWLPDLSLRDPYFITPLFMGVSMFILSWIGMRGMPPSPQGKMMSYVMPVMFTALFWNFASGLNLYYAVQNVAALPQQWLLARERTSKPTGPPGTK